MDLCSPSSISIIALNAFSAALCLRLTRGATCSSSSDESTMAFLPRIAAFAGLTGGGVGRLLVEGDEASSSESDSCMADLRLTPRWRRYVSEYE